MKTYKELLKESAVANIASGGNVAGMGYNLGKTEGQPMLSDRPADDLAINSKKKRKKFAGCDVFTMPTEDFIKCAHGRQKYERWGRKMNMQEIGNQDIKTFAHRNPGNGIIIQDEKSGVMSYLVHPMQVNEDAIEEALIHDLMDKHDDPLDFARAAVIAIKNKKLNLKTRGAANSRELMAAWYKRRELAKNKS